MTQATVREWSDELGGNAFLADGSVVDLPPQCLQGSVFRFLRPGQRIEVDLRGTEAVRVDLP